MSSRIFIILGRDSFRSSQGAKRLPSSNLGWYHWGTYLGKIHPARNRKAAAVTIISTSYGCVTSCWWLGVVSGVAGRHSWRCTLITRGTRLRSRHKEWLCRHRGASVFRGAEVILQGAWKFPRLSEVILFLGGGLWLLFFPHNFGMCWDR